MDINKLEKTVSISRMLMFLIIIVTLSSYLGWFYFLQEQSVSSDTQIWGAFGDFIGGILNPIIAFSAFYWLTVSVLVQKKELEETRKALTESSAAQKALVEAQAENLEVQKALVDAQNKTIRQMERDSRVDHTKLILSQHTLEIEAEHAYLNSLHELAINDKVTHKIIGRDGELISLASERSRCKKAINDLKRRHLEGREYIEAIISGRTQY